MSSEALQQKYQEFCATYPYRSRELAGHSWQLIDTAKGDRPVFLLSGLFGTGDSWFLLIEALKSEYRVLAPNLYKLPSLACFLEGLGQLMEEEKFSEVAVVGHSFGGMVSQCLLWEFPEKLQALVLSHTAVPSKRAEERVKKMVKFYSHLPLSFTRWYWKRRIRRWARGKPDSPGAKFWMTYRSNMINSLRKEDFANSYTYFIEMLERCWIEPREAEWQNRILIIESENDPAIGSIQREKLKQFYPGRVYTFQDSGHSSLVSRTETYCRVVREFLASVYSEIQ